MKGRKGIVFLVLIGAVGYIAFLIATLPSAVALPALAGGGPIKVYAPSGSIWEGKAAAVQLAPQVRLQGVEWDLSVLSLLTGSVGGHVAAETGSSGNFSGDVSVRGNGGFRLTQFRANAPLNELMTLSPVRAPVQTEGQAEVILNHLDMAPGLKLQSADGLISLNQTVLKLNRPVSLGNINLRLQPNDSGTQGKLQAEGGDVSANGDLQFAQDGGFTMTLRAQAAQGVDEDTRRALGMLGIPQDGSPLQVKLGGQLDASGVNLRPMN